MNLKEYQELCKETAKKFDTEEKEILTWGLGITGEAGDIASCIKKTFAHDNDQKSGIKENLGDTLWYAAMICNFFNWNMEEVLEENIEKLKKRYPQGFTIQDAKRNGTKIDWNEEKAGKGRKKTGGRKMKLDKKKELAARVLKTGKNKIIFDKEKLAEIKDAITKQDIRDLHKAGIIGVKEKKGRKKIKKRKTKRRQGKVKKRINKRKQEYVKITRKLRNYISELKKQDKISEEDYKRLRKEIKTRTFKSKAQLKEHLEIK